MSASARGNQKSPLPFLEMVLWMVVSYLTWIKKTKVRFSGRAVHAPKQ